MKEAVPYHQKNMYQRLLMADITLDEQRFTAPGHGLLCIFLNRTVSTAAIRNFLHRRNYVFDRSNFYTIYELYVLSGFLDKPIFLCDSIRSLQLALLHLQLS